MALNKEFYDSGTRSLARKLLGKVLVSETDEGLTSGIIVETEAYLFKNDPACHAHKGQTKRNAPMFGQAGTSYVYLIYGMYYCFNVVSAKKGIGEAVLIRALEPLEGKDIMFSRRGVKKEKDLCSGPGKLCDALAINKSHNELCLRKSVLRIKDAPDIKKFKIYQTTRIGINVGKDLPLRYYIKDNSFISKP